MFNYPDRSKTLFMMVLTCTDIDWDRPINNVMDWHGATIDSEFEDFDLYESDIESGAVEVMYLIFTGPDKKWQYIAGEEKWTSFRTDGLKVRYNGRLIGNHEDFCSWVTFLRLSTEI